MILDEGVISKIRSLSHPALVAVSGFGGSGKTTCANMLAATTGAPVIGLDSFVQDKTLTDYSLWNWFDFERFEQEVLLPFAAGECTIRYGHFDWDKNKVIEMRSVSHQGLVIVEGVGLLRPKFLKYFSYKIWVDCPLEEALSRGKKRDREEYNNPNDEQWEGIWKKNDLEYLETFKPKERADIVITNCE